MTSPTPVPQAHRRSLRQRFYRYLPHSLQHQLMLLTAICLIGSLLSYGAYTANRQITLAQQTMAAQMTALAQNLATINAHFLTTNDLGSLDDMAMQTALVPGILSVLVTDTQGKPLSELVNMGGQWSPNFNTKRVDIPSIQKAFTEVMQARHEAATRHAVSHSIEERIAWHPVVAGVPLGWVRISYDLTPLRHTALDIWAQALAVIALAITASLALLAWLLHAPMQALREATAFAANLEQIDGKTMPLTLEATELNALRNALNGVSTRLLTQHQDLINLKFAVDQHAIVSITALNGNITYANDLFCQTSGLTQADLLGQNHRITNSGFHPPEFFKGMWETVSRGQVWHGEIKNKRKDGSFYWVDSTIVPLMGADGLPQQYIGIRTDITAIKELENSLQLATDKAQAANKAKSEFLANMSHEIRTPMNGVIGMAQLALGTALDETQRSYIKTVQSSAQSLMVILNDILDFSKIEAGKLNIELIDFSLRDMVLEALLPMVAMAERKQLVLVSLLPLDLPSRVRGDPGRIRQVLTNLCHNAIKFTAEGEITVEVSCTSKEGVAEHAALDIHFSVRDTGIGIPQDKQKTVFEAFSQADNSTTRKFGGTGLGLTICARLVALMGGTIGLESTPNHGSTFYFTVPASLAKTASIPPQSDMPASPSPTESMQTLQVLLVEDHPVNQILAQTLLEKWGHRVVLAENGKVAVELFPSQAWDVILMDMQMPVMGGPEATALIRGMEPIGQRTPIVAVTANARSTDRDACLASGMDAFLTKPLSATDLQATLARLCRPRSAAS